MRVTINDVAKAAGVSKATVSRVVSNNPAISEETRDKVKAIIQQLGYKPNQLARNLATSQTRTLGVILPIDANDSFGNPIFIQMMQGISKYAQEQGYYLMYAFGEEKEEAKNIKEFSSAGIVDGIIVFKTEANDEQIKFLKASAFPFVVIGRPGEETSALWVDNDNFGATFEIVDRLIKKGYKDIGFIGAKAEWTVAKDRLGGYKRALQIHNIPFNEDWVYHGCTFNEAVGKKGYEMISKRGLPQAMITTDDLIALGFQREMTVEEIERIPVIGFNNTLFGVLQSPAFSSVEIHGDKLGQEAAKVLIERIEGNNEEGIHHIVETELVCRGLLDKS